MQVGELAAETGVSVRAIRHYERSGLVAARRRANGYRVFEREAVHRVRAIRDLLEVGLTLDEINSLSPCLHAAARETRGCRNLTAAMYRETLESIDQRLGTLAQLRDRIEERLAELEPAP